MLQTFLNMVEFGMNPQQAVEAPRFATQSFPDSFQPHAYQPNRLMLESRLPKAVGEHLSAVGHDVHWWPQFIWRAGGMCAIRKDPDSGMMSAGADPRRACYALGW
jgi:gamma-glutamyltranspeptidase/glutathione hydrolase